MGKLKLGGGTIRVANSNELMHFETVKRDTMADVSIGQVCYVDGTELKLANESTDKNRKCYVARDDFSKTEGRLLGDGSYEMLTATQNDFYCKITDSADFLDPIADLDKKIGLDSTGKKLNIANATELVQITSISGDGQEQFVYFKFL